MFLPGHFQSLCFEGKDQKTIYLEIFDTGGNVLLIKLFAEVKHVGGEQGLAVCPSEGKNNNPKVFMIISYSLSHQ